MDLNILSLPPEILAKIFSNIPWNKLINIKLTTRDFNYVTEKYHKHMQKPKLYSIIFENDSTHDDGIDRIRIAYSFVKTNVNPTIEDVSDVKEFFLPSSEPDQLHSFLQEVDLTSLNLVDIVLINHTEVIRIFSGYFYNTNVVKSIHVAVIDGENGVDNTLPFLQKIRNVENLELQLWFQLLSIPRDFIIPVRDSLEVLNIYETEDIIINNPRVLKCIVENNPNLSRYSLHFEDVEIYRIAIETIVEGELSRRSNGCFHKYMSLTLDIPMDNVPSELLNYFDSEEFPYTNTFIDDEDTIYKGDLECPVCGGFDSIEIFGIRYAIIIE